MYQQIFVFGAAFLGSAVETTEALTFVLAVGLTRGWREPLLGTLLAVVLLGLLVLIFGQLIVTTIPEWALKLLVGALLLLFGLRWLHKAVLRSAGIVAAAEGMGASWPGDFLSIFLLAAIFLVASQLAVTLIRRPALA